MRRPPSSLPLAVFGALSCAACGASDPPRTVVVISLDTCRADAVTFTESTVTPRLSALAERGTVFEQALAGSSWTLPSHAQMFTGQPPALHGVLDDDVVLDPATPTLPELLHDDGFFTCGVYSGLYLAKFFGFGRGFDEYANAIEGGPELEALFASQAERGELAAGAIWRDFDLRSHRDISSPRIVEQADRLIRAAGDRDLFLFAHFFDPHYDYIPPAPYDARFDADYQGDLTGEDFFSNPRVFDAQGRPQRLPDRDLQHLQALYLGEMAWTDEHVGQLLDLLDRGDRLDDAWIFVVGDHGEEFFEHGSWGHRATLFEEQLRIPFLVVPPVGYAEGAPRSDDTQVTLSELLPTVLDGLGLEVPESADGRSLVPVLSGGNVEPRPAVSSLRSRPRATVDDGAADVEHVLVDTLRTPNSKLIRTSMVQDGETRLLDVTWYDLESDPYESQPVADRADPRLRAAYEALEVELARLNGVYDSLPHAADAERSSVGKRWFSDRMLEQLGYTDGTSDAPDLDLPWGLRPSPPLPLDD